MSSDGAWVVYTADGEKPGSVELISVSVTGTSAPRRLDAPLPASPGYRWTISPDGRRVVFLGYGLFSAPIDGSSPPVTLDDASTGGVARDFVLSSDGTRVVFRAGPPELEPGLFSVALEGGAPPLVLVAPNATGAVQAPYRVDPGGTLVLFGSYHGDGARAGLYSAPIGGGSVVHMSHLHSALQDLWIAPDGSRSFSSCVGEAGRACGLHTVPTGGAGRPAPEVTLVPGQRVERLDFSPEGAWGVFLCAQGDGRNELYAVRADGGGPPHRIARNVDHSFRIHPSGALVLYRAERGPDERLELFAASLDGRSEPRRLSAALGPDGTVGWFDVTRDGSRVVYHVSREGAGASPARVSELWQVTLEGAPSSRIAEVEGARAFQLGPEGGRVFHRDPHGSLRSVALDGGSVPIVLEPRPVAGELHFAGDWVLYSLETQRGAEGLFLAPADGHRSARVLVPPSGSASSSAVVPGGPGTTSTAPHIPVGFRDFSFGTTGSSTPTGEKPECKLWWNDGFWWGSLYDDVSQDYHIYGLNPADQRWVDTGTLLDDRRSSKADVLWDDAAQKLFVASHIFSTNPQPTASNWGRLARYSYSSASKTYALDPGFPVDITRGTAEALTIAKDSQGRLWATWVEAARVMVNHSLASDSEWSTPFVLPAGAMVNVSSDDISAIVAFGTSQVGVMWSNQLAGKTYFAMRRDTDATTVWQPAEVVDPSCSGACSADVINMKATPSGFVAAVFKTSLTALDDPLDLVAVRSPAGAWTSTVFARVRDHLTRAILLMDTQNGRVYVFATHPERGGAIHYKSALFGQPFEVGVGRPFLLSPQDTAINNATSTKQNLNGQTELLVLASDQDSRFYLHNFLRLP